MAGGAIGAAIGASIDGKSGAILGGLVGAGTGYVIAKEFENRIAQYTELDDMLTQEKQINIDLYNEINALKSSVNALKISNHQQTTRQVCTPLTQREIDAYQNLQAQGDLIQKKSIVSTQVFSYFEEYRNEKPKEFKELGTSLKIISGAIKRIDKDIAHLVSMASKRSTEC